MELSITPPANGATIRVAPTRDSERGLKSALRSPARGVKDWSDKMKTGFRSGTAPESFCAGAFLRASDVGERPPPGVPMRPICVHQRFCRGTFAGISDVGDRPPFGRPMRFIGIEQMFESRAPVRTQAVGDPPLGGPMNFIGIQYRFCSRTLVRASAIGGPRLGGPRKLIGIRRSFRARASFGTPDVGEHSPSGVPMPPVPREDTRKVKLRVTRYPCGS